MTAPETYSELTAGLCPRCAGTGKDAKSTGIACWKCGGTGAVVLRAHSPAATMEGAEPVAVDDLTLDELRGRAIRALREAGWRANDKLSLHSVIETMIAFGINIIRDKPASCGWPDCGCDADAVCNAALVPAPAATRDADAVRVINELKFALFASDMTIKDRADQSARLFLEAHPATATTMEGAEPVATVFAWAWTLFGSNGSMQQRRLTFTKNDPFAFEVSISPSGFTSIPVALYTRPAPAAPTLEATAPAVSEAELEAAAREIASGRYDEVSDIFTGDRDDWIIMHWHELMPTARAALEAAQRARK